MIIQLYDSFGILELIPYSYGSDNAVHDLIYLMGIHSSASSIFGKVEVPIVLGQ